MSEERRICAAKPIKPVACSFGFETQPFEFAARPSHAYLSVATGARTNRQMDERTRTLYTAPEFRRTAPPPIIETKRKGSRSGYVVGLIILIAVLGGGYWLYRSYYATASANTAARNAQSAPPQSVGAATIGQGDIRVIVNALGTVTPIATVTVQTQINGQLLEVGFTEGQLVKKGDFLAQIDPRPYQLLQAQFEGQLAHDQGVLAQSKIDLARYQKLAEQNSMARQQYEDQVYIVQQNQGTVKLDQAQIDQQKLNVIYCRIVSPVTGRIGLRLVDPGNYIQTTNSTGIAVVTQMQPITVIFPIPEDDLPDILPQLNAGTPLEVLAYDRANVKQLTTGRVMALDSQIDTTTGTVKVRAQFDNADNALFPNQFVNAQLLVKTLHNAVTVPTAAIQRGAPDTYVYVINADNTVSVRPVGIGPTDGPMAAVNSGLSVAERVVVDGTDLLRDGARVIVPGPRGQTPAAANPPSTAQNPTPNAPNATPNTQNPPPNAQPQNPGHAQHRRNQ
jgi:multidrug efflux system membrane fusion protein